MYSSSPVRHAGRYCCLTSENMSPIAVLSDALCLTFFRLSDSSEVVEYIPSVTFSKTFKICSDGHVWQSNGKRFLNYNLYHRVLSDICLTGQKWAKTAYAANHTLAGMFRAALVPPRRSARAQGMPDRLPRPDTPYEHSVSDIRCQTFASVGIHGKMWTCFHHYLSHEKSFQ